jgi:hypothetical protein
MWIISTQTAVSQNVTASNENMFPALAPLARLAPSPPVLGRALFHVKRLLRRLVYKQAAKNGVKHPFDVSNCVETSGLLETAQLVSGHPNDVFNTAYFGVPPSRFRNAIERWQATPEAPHMQLCQLIDIGCGKGRAVLLGSAMPFREVIGVELHPELARIANANLDRWSTRADAVSPASIVCADAPSVIGSLLNGATLLYVYNPFRPPVLRQMLRAIVAQRCILSAPVDILYLCPEHEDVFREFPEFQRVWHEQISLAPEDMVDGLSSALDPCSLYRLRLSEARTPARLMQL